MSLQRRINKRHSPKPKFEVVYPPGIENTRKVVIEHPELNDLRDRYGAWDGPNHPDKGKENGRCNRTACQRPLAEEPVHQFMDGNFTGGPKLFYCRKCAWDFDDWDHQSGDPVRIKREPKA